jgi:hypothetical protein
MTLTQLYDHVAPHLPASIATNLKTAIKVLAQALGYQDPSHCPQEAFTRPLPDLYRVIEAHLVTQSKSDITIRNTKNYLSRMFRLAASTHLLETPAPHLRRQVRRRERAHRPGGKYSINTGRTLPYRQWPLALQRAFAAFERWATDPVVEGRDARWKKRQTTIDCYRRYFECYFGYLYHTRHIRQPTFNHLFDFTLIRTYIYWYTNKIRGKPTRQIQDFIKTILMLAHQYRPLPEFHAQLKELKRKFPPPSSHYDKADAWVPLAEIAAIGRDLWPRKPPVAIRGEGNLYARNAGLSLAFQLWSFIPYRSRNMREMALDTNLRKDASGKWRIIFTGDQLKVATKRGQPNVFDLPFPEELVPTLEEYLSTWRPILAIKSGNRHANVFLNSYGSPYSLETFRHITGSIVYNYTNKFWHPHIIRTVWATEWIRDKNPGDFYSAAEMLNDTLPTVISRYSHLLADGVAEKVYARLSQGARP